MKILLVEDNVDHRELMRLALTGHDSTWEVEGVGFGEEALCLLLGGKVFDLVFLDYSLPQRDGLWFLGEIRRGKAPPPVVMVTGRGDEQVAVEAMKRGAYDYVVKQEGYLERLPVVARHAMEANRMALERKQAEEALRESEERYRRLVENAPDVIYSLAEDGTITSLNSAFERITGWSRSEWIGKPFMPLVHPDDLTLALETFQQLSGGGTTPIYELRILSKSGKYFIGEFTSVPNIEKGKVMGEFGIARDITERKQMEEEIWRHNEELTALNAIAIMVNSSLDLQQILDQTLDKVLEITKMEVGSLYLTDPQTEELVLSTYRGVSKEFGDQVRTFKLGESIVGLAAQSGKPIVADDLTGDPRVTTTLVSGEGIRSLAAIPMKSKNKVQGMINMASYTCHSFTNEEIDFYTAIANQIGVAIENARLYEAVQRELTERKQAEEALKKSAQLLKDTGEMAKVGGWELDLSTKEVLWTEEVVRIHGVEPGYKPKLEEAMNFYAPESRPALEVVLKKAAETGEPYDLESLFIPSGSKDKIWVRSLGRAVYSGGKIVKLTGTFQNIDKYKRAEEALRVSLEKYRVLFESFPLGITISDKSGKIIEVNRQSEQLLGITREAHAQRRIDSKEWQIIRKDGTPMPAEEYASVRALKENRLVENVEMGIVKDKGEITWISVTAAPIPLEGYGVAIAYGDITERKRAEEALRRAEENFHRSLDDSPLGVRIVTKEGETVYTNRAILDIYGYDSIEELRTTPIKKRYTPESYAEFQIRKKKRQQGEYDPPEYEISIVKKNGEVRHLQVFRKEVLWNDEKQCQVIYLDITERKWAEEALQESKELFEKTFISQRDAIFLLDAINPPTILDCNPAATEVFGYTRQEMVGRTMDFLHVDETTLREFQGYLYPTIAEHGFMHLFEFQMRRKDSKVFPTEHSVIPLEDIQGKRIGLVSVVRDITEAKRAKEELMEREMFNFALFEYNPIQTVVVDLEGKVTGFNLAKKKSGDRLPNIGDVMYKDYAGKHENDMYGELIKCIRSGEIKEFPEQKYADKVLSITISPFAKGAVTISQDITERKRAEERILTYQDQLRSLMTELSLIEERERRHIATELHDNISQTLAIIKIKLGMAQEVTSSTDWVGSLNEIGELIDQAVQYTRSLTFELSPPILYELGFEAAAEWLTEKIQEQHHIEIGFEDDRRSKPMSEEIRIALFKATKELLINIVKHAQASKAKVSIWREDHSIRIRVEDDGVGFSTSEGKELGKTTGFGLFNTRERIKYLGGDMVIESEPGRGTRVTLSAPLEEKEDL